MKRYHKIAGICVLAVALFLAVQNLGGPGNSPEPAGKPENRPTGRAGSSRPTNAEADSSPTGADRRDGGGESRLRGVGGRRELPGVATSIQVQSSFAGGEVFGVRIEGEIKDGETLVTGGNLGPDGSHELTLITPSFVELDGGQEAVRVDMKVISAGAELIEENDLQSIGGNAQSALQVAEAWRTDQTKKIVESAERLEGSSLLSAPRVIAASGKHFTISMGDAGGSGYTLQGTITRAEAGGFTIQSRLERSMTPKRSK